MASNSQIKNDGTGDVTVAVDAWLENETDATVDLCVQTRIWGNSTYGPWGYGIVGQSGYEGNGSNWAEAGRGVLNYGNTVVNGTRRWTVPKTNTGWNASCWAKAWGETVDGYGAYSLSFDTRCDVWIPARTRHEHGTPSISTNNTGFLQGEKVTISWSKSSTQGNANFDRFELWRGNTKLYSGAKTSYTEVASNVTGANGGSITYTVKEIHEWYGSYPSTQASKTVYVIKNHGNPTVNADRNGYYQGEKATISWVKASNQGNSTLDRFELWRNNTKLYSGTNTSYQDTPSNVTGANGGYINYTIKEVHTFHGRTLTTQSTKSIGVIKNFGTPTLTASKSPCNYSESITLGFQKASEQGNAVFNKFELYRGNTRLYSGVGASYKVTPSDYSGARGGDVTFKLKEVHEWYGRYPEKETTIVVNVRSGVVSAYDTNGNRHTGLVTVYDSNGLLHYVLLTAYDSDGKAHSVV